MSLQFSTKAKTLKTLSGLLKTAKVADICSFTVSDFFTRKESCLDDVKKLNPPWIVRSSSTTEDCNSFSNAGAFSSLMNVNSSTLEEAIISVIKSYGDYRDNDEVLIQPMLDNVICAGVAFSHDPNTCSPYRIINWSEDGRTDTVTSGSGGKTWQHSANCTKAIPNSIQPVLTLIDELLDLFGGIPIDLEFALTGHGDAQILWLLQARPLVLVKEVETNEAQYQRLEIIKSHLERCINRHPFLMGEKTIYGVMPDWNPAEIIGIRPKPLALSLYKELVTDSIWAYQRHNYGYKNLRSFPLLTHFYGLPYIDVRLSFNSFVPGNLDENLGNRLVDYYLERLVSQPTLHDKVEFDVVFSCFSFDIFSRLDSLKDFGFSNDDIIQIVSSLRKLTNRIINPKSGLWITDSEKISILNKRRSTLLNSRLSILDRIYWLLEDTKRYGTLPFAGLARAGFVAVQFLKSLVSTGIFSNEDYDLFLSSVSTVSGQLAWDRSNLDKSSFLAQYGHLRPGTYDIESHRYDEAPDLYFDWSKRTDPPAQREPFKIALDQMQEISKLLTSYEIDVDAVGLLEFIKRAIELRESSKFNFTRNLSDALALIAQYGSMEGYTREDLAYCDIRVFSDMHISAINKNLALRTSIDHGKLRYEETRRLSLPPLIVNPDDIFSFELPQADPNYITQKQITANVVNSEDPDGIANAIVCIPNADPGFDWLFSRRISGLITAWGGVNSHMAIRAGELGLPAVIGAGEQLYNRWSRAKKLHLDCGNRRVSILA